MKTDADANKTARVLRPQRPNRPYSGYHATAIPGEDKELTHVEPGMPCGEYMRRYWHPVAISSQLKPDLPMALRILGEDLVLFRNGSGQIGLLHLHCSHRGASLEFGVVTENGLRCCYHGWHYAVDGTILETPNEPDGAEIKDYMCHGAYPVKEYKGLIFAYMGPPEKTPEFPLWDVCNTPDTRMLPYCIFEPCNFLQIQDNGIDPMHTVFLHTRVKEVQLGKVWGEMPTLEYGDEDGRAYYISVRRFDDFLWVRSAETLFPNIQQTGAIWWDRLDKEIIFSRVSLTRWNTPIDSTNTLLIGWRYFNDILDPDHVGREDQVGYNKVDFAGQTAERSYEERQRNPGDYDAQVGQRPIAIHALESLGTSDRGVATMRRHLRRAIRGELDQIALMPVAGEIPTYAHDTVVRVPARDGQDDKKLMIEVGRRTLQAIGAGNPYPRGEREAVIERELRKRIAAL